MQRITFTFAVMALALLSIDVGAKPVPKSPEKPPAKSEDKEKLQGEWVMESRELRGQMKPTGYTLTIKGDLWVLGIERQAAQKVKDESSTTFKIDQSKTPKTIDLTTPRINAVTVTQGIYKLEGDRFTILQMGRLAADQVEGVVRTQRPTEFKTTAEDGLLVVWKRVSAAK
jgi:uncharacterized protein (TIGR03067 family)